MTWQGTFLAVSAGTVCFSVSLMILTEWVRSFFKDGDSEDPETE